MIEITNFGSTPKDIIELFIFNANNNLIESVYDSPYQLSSGYNDDNGVVSLQIDVQHDIRNLGYVSGKYVLNYNFYRNIVGNNLVTIPIRDISNSRKEIRIVVDDTNNSSLVQEFLDYNSKPRTDTLGNALDYVVNFGNNKTYRVVNWILDIDTISTEPYCYVLKLDSELDNSITTGARLYVQQRLADSVTESIIVYPKPQDDNLVKIRMPNFSVLNEKHFITATSYKSWNDLLGTHPTSSQYLVNQYFSSSAAGIDINIDYRTYDNFVFYSSAVERLKNFRYKLKLLEYYDSRINSLGSISSSLFLDNNIIDARNKRNTVIAGFDGYEKYLYYESGSYESSSYGVFNAATWPKTNSTQPYTLHSTTGSYADSWYNAQLETASRYDFENANMLINTIPGHVRLDSKNDSYVLFVNMVAQHFDTLWTYVKSTTNIYDRDESLSYGMSKDLIFQVLKSLGVPVDHGKQIEDLWLHELGLNASGSYTQSGSLHSIPMNEYTKQIWKRILNNLPYLLKTKGTERGIRALINCYGIPDTLYRIKEYGGPELDENTISRRKVDRFSYELAFPGTTSSVNLDASVHTKWDILPCIDQNVYNGRRPDSTEIRFKLQDGRKDDNIIPSQSLFAIGGPGNASSIDTITRFSIKLTRVSSSLGYASLVFLTGSSGVSSNRTIISQSTEIFPLFNGDEWSLLWKRYDNGKSVPDTYGQLADNIEDDYSTTYQHQLHLVQYKEGKVLYHVSTSINRTGYLQNLLFSSSTYTADAYIGGAPRANSAYLNWVYNGSIGIAPAGYIWDVRYGSNIFSGSVQEFRYWNQPLDTGFWISRSMDPESIEANYYDSPYRYLGVRYSFTQPKNLYADPYITSSHPNQSLTTFGLSAASLNGQAMYRMNIDPRPVPLNGNYQYFNPITEFVYTNWPSIGMNREISNKIRIETGSLDSNILDSKSRIEKNSYDLYPLDSPKVGVYFSPQNEINEDIAQQFGRLVLDDYIGNPNDDNNFSYPDLEQLSRHYWKKYQTFTKFDTYNFQDYIKLIGNLDSSLYYLIKNFLPAKAAKEVGLVIEPTLLERSKIKISDLVEVENVQFEQELPIMDKTILAESIMLSGSLPDDGNFVKIDSEHICPLSASYSLNIITIQDDGYQNVASINTNITDTFTSAGVFRARYEGTKISSIDFNVNSTDTIDNKPVVEYWYANPNIISIGTPNAHGSLHLASTSPKIGKLMSSIFQAKPIVAGGLKLK